MYVYKSNMNNIKEKVDAHDDVLGSIEEEEHPTTSTLSTTNTSNSFHGTIVITNDEALARSITITDGHSAVTAAAAAAAATGMKQRLSSTNQSVAPVLSSVEVKEGGSDRRGSRRSLFEQMKTLSVPVLTTVPTPPELHNQHDNDSSNDGVVVDDEDSDLTPPIERRRDSGNRKNMLTQIKTLNLPPQPSPTPIQTAGNGAENNNNNNNNKQDIEEEEDISDLENDDIIIEEENGEHRCCHYNNTSKNNNNSNNIITKNKILHLFPNHFHRPTVEATVKNSTKTATKKKNQIMIEDDTTTAKDSSRHHHLLDISDSTLRNNNSSTSNNNNNKMQFHLPGNFMEKVHSYRNAKDLLMDASRHDNDNISVYTGIISQNGQYDRDDQRSLFSLGDPLHDDILNMGRWRNYAGAFVNSFAIQLLATLFIMINSIILGILTYDGIPAQKRTALEILDTVFLSIFTVEMFLQIFYLGVPRFIRHVSLFLEFLIVIFSWAFAGSSLTVLRSFRVFRLFTIFSKWEFMRRLVQAVGRTIPKMASIWLAILLFFYVFCVLFTELYKDLYPEGYLDYDYFGSLDKTFLTLFQFMTLDSWSNVVREVIEARPWSLLAFCVWVIITAFFALNLVIAVICDTLIELNRLKEKKRNDRMMKNQRRMIASQTEQLMAETREIANLQQSVLANQAIIQQALILLAERLEEDGEILRKQQGTDQSRRKNSSNNSSDEEELDLNMSKHSVGKGMLAEMLANTTNSEEEERSLDEKAWK